MEATNHYWETLVDFLDEHGFAWQLSNPFTAKRHREGADLARTKHDGRDVLQFDEMLRIGYFTETKRLPPAYAAPISTASVCSAASCARCTPPVGRPLAAHSAPKQPWPRS